MEQNNKEINSTQSENRVGTDYGEVPEAQLDALPEKVRYCTPRKAAGTGKKIVLWIMGAVGCVSFLLVCGTMVFASVMYTMGYRLTLDKQDSSFKDDDFLYFFDTESDSDTSQTDLQINESSDAGLGIVVLELDGSKAETYGIKGGLVIAGLTENTSFAGTDVKVYDIITAADGKEVTSVLELSKILNTYQPGEEMTVTITRFKDGFPESFDIVVTLIDKTKESAQG